MSDCIELEIPLLRVRWTVNAQSKPGWNRTPNSSIFQFQGVEWRLYYYYERDVDEHRLVLEKMSRGHHDPFDVSVHVEAASERIVMEGLSLKGRFEADEPWMRIWSKPESDVVRSCPESQQREELRFLVELKEKDVLTDVKSSTTQTKATRESPHGISTSAQTECQHPKTAEQSPRPPSTTVQTSTLLLQNTPACIDSLLQDLSKMLERGSELNVEFRCSGQSIRAHGAVVSARSEVIESMLTRATVEGKTKVIKISNMEPEIFQHLLKYIYTGSLPELNPDLAMKLYEAGDKYAVLALAKRCSQYLLEHLSVQNACSILVVADDCSNVELKELVIGFILDQQIPLSGTDWQDFCDSHSKLATEVLNRFCLRLVQQM